MECIPSQDPSAGERTAAVLAAGGVVLYPTDTVYGLGADATNAEAVAKVRSIKDAPASHYVMALVADYRMLTEYAAVPRQAEALVARLLPGALSLVLDLKDKRLCALSMNDTAGFRLPNHPFCLEIARTLGKPITSTSANPHGVPTARTVPMILDAFREQTTLIDLVIDGGPATGTTPSTILDLRGDVPILVRAGAIDVAELEAVIGPIHRAG